MSFCGPLLQPTASAAGRIVIVLHDFSGGGTEQVAVRLANAWTMLGRDVTIFCGTEQGCVRPLVASAVRVVASPRRCERSSGSCLRLAEALASYAQAERPDVLFAPGNFHLPILLRFAAISRSNVTTIGKISNPLARSSIDLVRWLTEAGLRHLTGSIDCLVAMSPALRLEAARILRRDDIVHAWEPILPDIRRLPRPKSRRRVLVVGRLEPQKNIGVALDAFARSCASSDAELLILGEGSERRALWRRARRLGIEDRVFMPGHSDDVMTAMTEAALLLLTSHYEGYPAVLVEAIAAGVPVIATRCSPAIEEIVSWAPGIRIVDGNQASIAAAIDAVLQSAESAPGRSLDLAFLAKHRVTAAAADYLAILDGARSRAMAQARTAA